MEEIEMVIKWAFEQVPIVTVLAIGGVALWRQSLRHEAKIQQMLDQCWTRLLEVLDKDNQ